eukprot:PhF_6_TR10654/c0_g1_i3/m.17246
MSSDEHHQHHYHHHEHPVFMVNDNEYINTVGEPVAPGLVDYDAPPLPTPPTGPLCMSCRKASIEYASSTCGHPMFCKKCAMRCATGGKCKVCGSLYPDLKRI